MKLDFYEKVKSGEELSIAEINAAIKGLKEILAKGGVVVVSEGNRLITTYNLESFNRKLARRS